jgi:WD40 repeat protein
MRTTTCIVVLLAFLGVCSALRAAEQAKDDGSAEAYRQLGRLRAGMAFKAREEEHDPLRAAHLYIQAAQAFYRAHDEEYRKGLVAGTLAIQSLRATSMHPLRVVAMTFLPGDKQVVTCGADGSVRVWDALSGREVRSFQALDDAAQPDGKFHDVVFTRDRSRLLLRGFLTVQVWDIATGKLLRSWKPRAFSEQAAFLPDGKRVLVWGKDPPARLLDVETGEELRQYEKGRAWRPSSLSPDGRGMLTWDREGVYLWDVDAGELKHTLPGVGMDLRSHPAFTPDGRQVAVAGYPDGSTRLFDVATGRQVQSFVPEAPDREGGWLRDVRFSADGRRLLIHATNGKVRVWDRAGGKLVATLATTSGGGARFSPDGKVVVVPGDRPVLWTLADEESTSLGKGVSDAVFAPDGRRFVLIGPRAELWDGARKERLRTFGEDASGAAFSEDGSLLLVSSIQGPMRSGVVRLWTCASPRRPGPPWKRGRRSSPCGPSTRTARSSPLLSAATRSAC